MMNPIRFFVALVFVSLLALTGCREAQEGGQPNPEAPKPTAPKPTAPEPAPPEPTNGPSNGQLM